MKWRLVSKIISFVLAIVCLLIAGVRMQGVYEENRPKLLSYNSREFPTYTESKENNYRIVRTLKKLELKQYGFLQFAEDSGHLIRKFTLPEDITYYKNPSVFSGKGITLKKGTEVFAATHIGSFDGYGFCGYPDYKKGWHYVIPFVPVGTGPDESWNENHLKKLMREACLYVKTEDLLAAAEAFYLQNETNHRLLGDMSSSVFISASSFGILSDSDDFVAYPRPEIAIQFFRDRGFYAEAQRTDNQTTYLSDAKSYAALAVLYKDIVLEVKGQFLSPTFLTPYFDTTNIVLLSTSGVLLFLHILLRIRKAK